MSPTKTLRYSLGYDLDDDERKEGRLLSAGDVEIALSDMQGNLEGGTINVSLSDLNGRPIGSQLEVDATKNFQRDELVVCALSDHGRRTGATPRKLGRALVQDTKYGSPVVAKFSGSDPFFCDGGAFSSDKKFPTFTVPTYYINAPPDIYSSPMFVILGEKSDEGATDPNTNLPSARGLVPVRFVGLDGLATGPGGAADVWGRFHVCLFASYQCIGLYGSDFGGGIYGRSGATGATSNGASPTSVITLAGSPDLSSVSVAGDMAITLYTPALGKQERQIIAKTGNSVTINNAIDAADCTDVNWYIATKLPQRTKIDIAARQGQDVMVFGYPGYVRSTPYEDIMGSDGAVYRVTDLWIRGPLLAAHMAGEVTIGGNFIGVEDKGDGSGLPITDAFIAYLWWLENCVFRNSTQPQGPGKLWPQTDGDLMTYADGTYVIKGSTFVAAQASSAATFGGAGFQISKVWDTQMGMREAIALWNTNFNCRIGEDEHGQIICWRLDVLADTTMWPRVEHVSRVFGEVDWSNPQSEMENIVKGQCDWDSDGARYRNPLVTLPSPAGLRHNKGAPKPGQVIDGNMTSDPAQLAYVLNERLAQLHNGPIYVVLPGDFGLWDYPLGSGIQFTSIMGPGALGFVDKPLIIIKKRFAIDSRLVTLTCLDPPGMIPPGYAFSFDDN